MWSFILLASTVVACVAAHGRVFEPPSRSSAWRFGFPTPADYDDDGANCGGFSMQHSSNGGKCGICGDAYNIPPPRPHELGGTYGLGVVVAHYPSGSLMTTTVDLTTSHRGFWEFKLCPDPESNDQACFDKHVLATKDGETKYYPGQGSTKYNVTYRLPSGLVCEHCVLQWRYTAGNNWGICANGSSGLGCGAQEQFGACSDIAIGTTKSSVRDAAQSDIPAPLLYYLKNGYFDAQQGVLHLLRGTAHPNAGSSHNTVQHQHPVQPSLPRGQHPQSAQQRPTQPNQNPRPTQQIQRPLQTIQRVHPNQIAPQNTRPLQNGQTNKILNQSPQKGSPHADKHKQGLTQSQKLIKSPEQESQGHNKPSSYQYQQQTFQVNQQNRQHKSHQQQSIQGQHPVQQKQRTPTQLEVLVQKHRDQQKQLKEQSDQPPKSINSLNSVQSRPITQTIQVTTHTVHSYTVPLKQHPGLGNLKQWKTGKAARYKKSNKKKHKGKPRKRKQKTPFGEYNRIIKVGTW